MRADGAAQELGAVADLAGVVADLLARGPQAGAGVLDGGQARHPGDAADQRLPGRVQKAGCVEHLDAAVLLAAMAAAVHGVMAVEGAPGGAKPGQRRMQGGLVVRDADQQGVAGRSRLRKPVLLAMPRVGGGETRSVCAGNSTPVTPSSATSFGTAAVSSDAPASS